MSYLNFNVIFDKKEFTISTSNINIINELKNCNKINKVGFTSEIGMFALGITHFVIFLEIKSIISTTDLLIQQVENVF